MKPGGLFFDSEEDHPHEILFQCARADVILSPCFIVRNSLRGQGEEIRYFFWELLKMYVSRFGLAVRH